MSFDLFLQSFSQGEPAPANVSGARDFLTSLENYNPNEFGWVNVKLPSGDEIEICGEGLWNDDESFEGAALHLHGLTQERINFIYNFANAAEFVIFNAQANENEPLALMPPSFQKENLPKDIEDSAAQISCEKELWLLISDDFSRWQKFCDQVLSDN